MRNNYRDAINDREFLSPEEKMRARIRNTFLPPHRKFTPNQERQIEDKVLVLMKLYSAPLYAESDIRAVEQELESLLQREDVSQLGHLLSELGGQ